MAEKQVPVPETSASDSPTLQLLGTDAAAGLCTGGYCVLPSTEKTDSVD